MGLREQIWDTDLDLQAFIVVDGRVFMMGFDGDASSEEATWNVAVEINMARVNAT